MVEVYFKMNLDLQHVSYLRANNSCRVYQDAEVNVTKNFTSKERVSLPPKRNLPNTMTGVFDLDPGSVVFYVGGYPDYFTVISLCFHFILPANL